MSHGYPGAHDEGYGDGSHGDEEGSIPPPPPQQGGGWPKVRNNPGPSMYGQTSNGYPQAGGYPQTGGYPQAQQAYPQAQQQYPQTQSFPQQGGNAPYPPDPYAQQPQGDEGYGGDSYGQQGYGNGQYGTDAYGSDSYGTDAYGVDTYGNAPQPNGRSGTDGYGSTTAYPALKEQEQTPAFARTAVQDPPRSFADSGRDEGGEGTGDTDGEKKAEAPKKPGRDRYLDLLRAIALVRVVFFHVFGWAWLTIIFPSMGVMFALAGSLMARSLARPALSVIKSRIRRLLIPFWLFSVFMLVAMFHGGWKPNGDDEPIMWWWIKLVWWFVPIGAPAAPWEVGSEGGLMGLEWAAQASGPLWYIRAYLWFVVLSPLMLKAFRKLPWVTMLAPLALSAVLGLKLIEIPGETGNAIQDFTTFASCWILGFAHNEGTLKKLKPYMIPTFAAVLMSLGLWWAGTHIGEAGWNFDEIPTANGLWSLGFCAILLHYSPSWQEFPDKLKGFDTPITLANNRAVTIYLWHEMAIMLAIPIIDQMWGLPVIGDLVSPYLGKLYQVLMFLFAWPLIALFIASFGWTEDFAAKRKPRLWPNGAKNAKNAKQKSAAAAGR
ncbi:acyltransferase family protein [Streptomyces sp. NPDC051561]|uniref:acyltransferase family protein n=1 Tax=Streptomyces sp. NPDC051561 TaxID=3365658 RepID=UPI0037B2474E